eukprot:GHVQ01026934.1.p1 GENE.GHVQ01026934.1~~GHVQ01026934.1.p1  ORF type:complete len:180 (+),score=28.76 GHVQ01026934.1:315-854(+)
MQVFVLVVLMCFTAQSANGSLKVRQRALNVRKAEKVDANNVVQPGFLRIRNLPQEDSSDDNAGDLDLKPDTVFSNILCVQCDQLNIMSIQIDEAIKEASEAHNGNEDKTVGSTPPTHEPVSDNAHIEQEIERLSAKASEIRKMLDSVSEQRNQNVLESGSETPSTSESLDARSNYSDCV